MIRESALPREPGVWKERDCRKWPVGAWFFFQTEYINVFTWACEYFPDLNLIGSNLHEEERQALLDLTVLKPVKEATPGICIGSYIHRIA